MTDLTDQHPEPHFNGAAINPREPLLKEADAATLINIAPRTLEQWRAKGVGPRFLRLNGSRAVRYRATDIQAWFDASAEGGAAA